jgi:biopolymer transport protein ExbD
MLTGSLDVYPVAGVLFLLVLMVLLQSSYVHVVGLPIRLAEGEGYPGVTNATVAVAVDGKGRFYYQNQLAGETELKRGFGLAAKRTGGQVTLVLLADRSVTNEVLLRVVGWARAEGIQDYLLAVRPPPPGPVAVP